MDTIVVDENPAEHSSGAENPKKDLESDPEMARVYHAGSLISRLVDSYITRVEILTKVVMELFKGTTSQRETLAKKLKEISALKAEISGLKESKEDTLTFLKSEMKRCSNKRDAIDINDIYNREATLCSASASVSFAFDVKALAKEYLRVRGTAATAEPLKK